VFNLKVIAVFGFLLINGCASSPEQKVDISQPIPQEVAKAEGVSNQFEKESDTAIDPDVLYLLLTAELAGQREQYDIALEAYLRAASRVDDPRLAERAARIALYLKDEKKTEEAVALWLAQNPEDLTARKIAVLSALRKKNKAAAIEHLNYLLQADPAGFEVALLELVKMQGDEEQAAFIYDVVGDMAMQHPDQAGLFFVQSLLAMQMQKDDLALEKVQQALQLQPEWTKALILQTQLLARRGDLEKAKEILTKLVEKNPDNEGLKKLLAQVLIKLGENQQAIELYQQILQDNPDDTETQYLLALVYLQLNEDENARNIFTALMNQPGMQMQSSYYIGMIESRAGNVDKALVWFDKVTSGPLVFDAALSAISLLMDEKRYVDAQLRLTSLKKQFPQRQLRLLLLEAELYNKQEQYEKSYELLTAALEKMPGQKELLYSRALIAERLDRLDVLEADLKQILEKDPDDANALNALGYTLADRTQRYAEAEEYLQRAITLRPDEPVIIDSYGWLQFRLGNLEQALTYLQRAYAELKEAEIVAHLVEVLWVMGRQEEAKALYAEAVNTLSEKQELLDLQQRIPELQ
jgi:tetratricopeptide (TPR) repeat protein